MCHDRQVRIGLRSFPKQVRWVDLLSIVTRSPLRETASARKSKHKAVPAPADRLRSLVATDVLVCAFSNTSAVLDAFFSIVIQMPAAFNVAIHQSKLLTCS
jgi:hypothetical protein